MLLTARRVGVGLWLMATGLSSVALGLRSPAISVWSVSGGTSCIGASATSRGRCSSARSIASRRRRRSLSVVYFDHGIKLSYPPSALLLWQAAASACQRCSADDLSSALSVLGLCLTLTIPLVMSAELLAGTWARGASGLDRVLIVSGVMALCAAYYPLVLANAIGQVQAWLNALFALAFWGFIRQRHLMSGVALGLMVLVKPYATLLVLWAALRGHRPLAIAAVATIGVGLSVALAMYGLDSHFGYLHMASVVSERGESLYANQSINGLLNRLFLSPEQIRWEHTAPPPYHPVVAIGTKVALVTGTAIALWWPVRRAAAGGWCDLAFASVIMLIVSPIGWEHYYPLLLPLYAMVLASMPATGGPQGDLCCWWRASCSTGIFLGPIARIETRTWSIFQSYQLAGAMRVPRGDHWPHSRVRRSAVSRRRCERGH